jgi:hypothetical protein
MLPKLTKIHTLRIGYQYNHIIKLPSTLKHLLWCNKNKIPALPNGLTHLTLINNKTTKMSTNIPKSLSHLMILESNVGIRNIPNTITHLTWECNNKLSVLHEGLLYLSVDLNYKYTIRNLPNTITHLIMGRSTKIDVFPPHLTYLKCPFDNTLPDFSHNLEYLIVIDNMNRITQCRNRNRSWIKRYKIRDKTMKSNSNCKNNTNRNNSNCEFTLLIKIKHLNWQCRERLPQLPILLKTLILGRRFNRIGIRCEMLNSLTKLTCLRWLIEQKLTYVPNNLMILELGSCYASEIPQLPITISRIKISNMYPYLNTLQTLYVDKIICN